MMIKPIEKLKTGVALVGGALAITALPAQAHVVAHFEEVGGTEVHVTWSGSLDTSGQSLVANQFNYNLFVFYDAFALLKTSGSSRVYAGGNVSIPTGFAGVPFLTPALPGTTSSVPFGYNRTRLFLPDSVSPGDLYSPTGTIVIDITLAELDVSGFLDATEKPVLILGNGDTISFTTGGGAVPDQDGDGVPDDEDEFPDSNTDPVVAVGNVLINNVPLENGSYLADVIAYAIANDVANVDFVQDLQFWRDEGYITGKDMGQILREHNTT